MDPNQQNTAMNHQGQGIPAATPMVLQNPDPRLVQQQLHIQQQLQLQQQHQLQQQQLQQQQLQMQQRQQYELMQRQSHPVDMGYVQSSPQGHVSPNHGGHMTPSPVLGQHGMPAGGLVQQQPAHGPPPGVVAHHRVAQNSPQQQLLNENPYGRLAAFEIEKKIGRGQFSVVSRARCLIDGQVVALKKVQV